MKDPRKLSEHDIQSSFVRLMKLQFPGAEKLLFAIPNQRRPESIGRYKAEGVKAGVPDMFLAKTINMDGGIVPCIGLWLEFKTDKGKITPAQLDWHRTLDAEGYNVEVVRSAEEALDVVKRYLRRGL